MLTSPEALRSELAEHDVLEIAAASGALQLLPENASHCDRLVALAAAALSGGGSGTRNVRKTISLVG